MKGSSDWQTTAARQAGRESLDEVHMACYTKAHPTMIISGIIPLRDGCVKACHGCKHRQWTQEQSLEHKLAAARSALQPWAEVIQSIRTATDEERWGYQERVQLTTRCYGGRWEFGLEPRDEFVPIPRCPLHSDRVNAAIDALRPHLPHFREFPLRFFIQNGSLVTLVVKASELRDTLWVTPELTQQLAAAGVQGLHLNLHPAAGKIVFADKGWHCLWGESLAQDALGLWHGPSSYSKPLPHLFAELLQLSERFLSPDKSSAVVDLYCGVGAGLQRWSAAGADTVGVDFSGEVVSCALRNAQGAMAMRGPVAQRLHQVTHWLAERQDKKTLAYVSPPPAGLEPEVTQWLGESFRPARIAVLARSASTLGKDLAALAHHGYSVAELIPFDFAPQTPQLEVLAFLVRN